MLELGADIGAVKSSQATPPHQDCVWIVLIHVELLNLNSRMQVTGRDTMEQAFAIRTSFSGQESEIYDRACCCDSLDLLQWCTKASPSQSFWIIMLKTPLPALLVTKQHLSSCGISMHQRHFAYRKLPRWMAGYCMIDGQQMENRCTYNQIVL